MHTFKQTSMIKKEKKRSIFERLAGGIRLTDENDEEETPSHFGHTTRKISTRAEEEEVQSKWGQKKEEPEEEEEQECELALDVYETGSDIMVQTFVAGVKPEDLEINITRDMVTIRGKRAEVHGSHVGEFFSKELYWGTFSRTVSLPEEVNPDESEAIERHGLLTIRLPKIDKNRKSNLKVKSV